MGDSEQCGSLPLPASFSAAELSPVTMQFDNTGEQQKLAGLSEVVLTSSREFILQESTAWNVTRDDASGKTLECDNGGGVQCDLKTVNMKVNRGELKMKQADLVDSDDRTNISSGELSSPVSAAVSSDDVRKDGTTLTMQSNLLSVTHPTSTRLNSSLAPTSNSFSLVAAETGEVEIDKPESFDYDFLQPTMPPPPPREIKDSESMPFPMIFRRSKKDPGSKQYNALVRELEQVLEKRNKIKRSQSLQDLDQEDVPEVVGTLRGTRKLSNSTDNLSVFSNKALLSRLENHFKNRANPVSQRDEATEFDAGGSKENAGTSSEHLIQLRTSCEESNSVRIKIRPAILVNGRVEVPMSSLDDVNNGNSTFENVNQNYRLLSEQPGRGVQISRDPAYSETTGSHREMQSNNYRDSASSPLHLSPEHDSHSRNMSFSSDDEFPMSTGIFSDPSHHYKKHNVKSTSSHIHHSRINPDVMFKSQTLDRNFRHVTRIAVSKSSNTDLGSSLEHQQRSHEPSNYWTMERHGSSPIKTVVEQFSDGKLAEDLAWNSTGKNSKKKTISQRMVQKFYDFVHPRSSGASVPADSSPYTFKNNEVPQVHVAQQSRDQQFFSENETSYGTNGNLVVELPNHAKLYSIMSPAASTLPLRNARKDVGGEAYSLQDGLTVQLPNNHKASIVPVSLQPINMSGGIIAMGSDSGSSIARSRSLPRTHPAGLDSDFSAKRNNQLSVPTAFSGSSLHSQSSFSAQDSSLTVQLPNNHTASIVPNLPTNISASKNGTPQVCVSPQRRSTNITRTPSYRQTYRPAEKGSPFTQEIGEGVLPPAHGDGLYRGEEDKPATFYIDARGMTGEPFVQVDGPNSIAKCSIDPQSDGQYAVTYIPVEVGLFDVLVKWNGKELPGSPYHPKVVCARKVQVVGGWQHYMDNKERIHLMVNEEKHIPFDVSDAGPGKMTAEAKGPSGLIPVTVDDSSVGRSTVVFTPREEGNYFIHLYWSDTPLTNSPFQGYATGGSLDPSKVILTGRGLKEAIVQEEAEFMIDASRAGPGEPEVQLTGVRAEVNVFVTPLGGGKFRCTYIPVVPGAYLLHISWNHRQLRGSPYKVNVIGAFYPNKVAVSGEGLKGGLLGRDLDVRIDTRRAGPGELTAYCMGPSRVAHCELEDHHDGTFRLIVRPQEAGRHVLQVKYGGEHVLGSPFAFKVSAQPDASKVRVSGPGVEHGILATFQSRFVVETRGAGAGQLTVRIRGPKGAFQVEMYRDSQKDRTILCRYDPTETGLYIISVRWSGVDVPGSPFHVHILDTQAELEQVLNEQVFHNASFHSSRTIGSGYGQWREEF